MIFLTSKELATSTKTHLQQKQKDIDGKVTFLEKKSRAKTLWNGKRGSQAGRSAFNDIKEKLIEMAVSIEVCSYCENNEATDIEHIFPKGWFPSKTFDWENYLLACGTCNTHYKKDKFAIFDPEDSNNVIDLIAEPTNFDAVFINPRKENPMDFLYLNIRLGIFGIHPKLKKGSRAYIKAKFTLETLGFIARKNSDQKRSALERARQKAVKNYFTELQRVVQVKQSSNFEELENVVTPLDNLNKNNSLKSEKNKLLKALKNAIQTMPHPTVWEELKRQRSKPEFQKINALFTIAPEVLEW